MPDIPKAWLDQLADELVAIRRDVIDGHPCDVDQLRIITGDLRLLAIGVPLTQGLRKLLRGE